MFYCSFIPRSAAAGDLVIFWAFCGTDWCSAGLLRLADCLFAKAEGFEDRIVAVFPRLIFSGIWLWAAERLKLEFEHWIQNIFWFLASGLFSLASPLSSPRSGDWRISFSLYEGLSLRRRQSRLLGVFSGAHPRPHSYGTEHGSALSGPQDSTPHHASWASPLSDCYEQDTDHYWQSATPRLSESCSSDVYMFEDNKCPITLKPVWSFANPSSPAQLEAM